MLPQDCLSAILSLTSPIDTCRSSVVSSEFSSASDSDLVWNKFLPSDHEDLVSRLVNSDNSEKSPLNLFSSKKELFFHLCNPVLLDGGKMCFKIDKSSGKKSYLISARELRITWSDEPMYWSWKNFSGSRFGEVVELRTISWLEIYGEIRTSRLSSYTKYGAYLVMTVSPRAYGLSERPFEASVQLGDHEPCHRTVRLCEHNCGCEKIERLEVAGAGVRERSDGWMEIEIGEFFAGEVDQLVKMSLTETEGYHLKAGLVIEGIEVRPKEDRKYEK